MMMMRSVSRVGWYNDDNDDYCAEDVWVFSVSIETEKMRKNKKDTTTNHLKENEKQFLTIDGNIHTGTCLFC
jgi:hypothetical protein